MIMCFLQPLLSSVSFASLCAFGIFSAHAKDSDMTTKYVTHDQAEAMAVGDRVELIQKPPESE